ncbi:hypothetical protein [Flavobacterium sp.]|nr:hypothetical protein [Flavobacterium sp.]
MVDFIALIEPVASRLRRELEVKAGKWKPKMPERFASKKYSAIFA